MINNIQSLITTAQIACVTPPDQIGCEVGVKVKKGMMQYCTLNQTVCLVPVYDNHQTAVLPCYSGP